MRLLATLRISSKGSRSARSAHGSSAEKPMWTPRATVKTCCGSSRSKSACPNSSSCLRTTCVALPKCRNCLHAKASLYSCFSDPDTNPTRISPRNLFDIALGSDSLWKKDSYSFAGKLTIVNVTNRAVLYKLSFELLRNPFRLAAHRSGRDDPTSRYFAGGGVPGGDSGGGGGTNFASSTGTFCFSSSTCTVNLFPGLATVQRYGSFTPSAMR